MITISRQPTELQQKIFDELENYASLEAARDNSDEIAKKAGCSTAYVKQLINRKSDSVAKVEIKVEPPEPEDEIEEESEDYDEEDYEEEPVPKPDWTKEFEESDEEPKPEDMPLDQILSKENVEMLISVPFRMAADFTGWDGAELTADEKKRISPMARTLMIKYIPDLLQMYFVELLFVLVIGEVIVGKYRAYNEFASEQESKKKAQEDAAKQAEIADKRRLEAEEAAETPPEPEEEPPPRTKEEAGDPSWNKPESIG